MVQRLDEIDLPNLTIGRSAAWRIRERSTTVNIAAAPFNLPDSGS